MLPSQRASSATTVSRRTRATSRLQVVGENQILLGEEELLRSRGVEVVAARVLHGFWALVVRPCAISA